MTADARELGPVRAVVLDVNETLSDMTPLQESFTAAGAGAGAARAWFAAVLRDGFALTAAGGFATFSHLAEAALHDVLRAEGAQDIETGSAIVLHALAGLGVHPDVGPGLRALRADGIRVVTLSNGAAASAADLLERAGLDGLVDRVLSVEDAGVWKPAPGAYAHALDLLDLPADQVLLAAVHPWDVDGATAVGMAAAWVNRSAAAFPTAFRRPTVEVAGLDRLADALRRAAS